MKGFRNNDWVFWHDGHYWVAKNPWVRFKGKELEDLDQLIVQWSRKHLEGIKSINLYFDNRRIPAWVRPYMGHYMNRVLKI